MKFRYIFAIFLSLMFLGGYSYGQHRVSSTQGKVTIAVTNTYQQAVPQQGARSGCTIQYVAVAGSTGYVYFAAAAPADTTTSFRLTNGQTIMCPTLVGDTVISSAVWVTGTGTDIFIYSYQ